MRYKVRLEHQPHGSNEWVYKDVEMPIPPQPGMTLWLEEFDLEITSIDWYQSTDLLTAATRTTDESGISFCLECGWDRIDY